MNTQTQDRTKLAYRVMAPAGDANWDDLHTCVLKGSTDIIVRNRALGYAIVEAVWSEGTENRTSFVQVNMRFNPPQDSI